MKRPILLPCLFAGLLLVSSSCSDSDDPTPGGASSNLKAEIYIVQKNGIYEKGVPLNEENYLIAALYVEEAGAYSITTSDLNGYKFTASGEFTKIGEAQVKLQGVGTPSNEQTDSIKVVTALDEAKLAIQVASNLSNKIIIARGGDNFNEVWKTIAFTGRGKKLWEIPSYASHAAISGTTVYLTDKEALKAVNIVTGAELWRNEALKDMSHVTFKDQVVYLANNYSRFWAVNASNGQVLWNYEPSSFYVPYGAPVVGTDKVYLTVGNTLHAVNKTNGQFVWEGTGFSSVGTPVLDNGTLYMTGGWNQGTSAVNASTGAVIWKNQVDTHESLVLKNGKLYGNGINVVHSFNASTGATLWSTEIEDLAKSPVEHNGNIYVTTDFGFTSVYALNGSTGAELWAEGSSMGFAESEIVAHQGMLYLGSSNAVDGYHANSGNIVTFFGGYGSTLAMDYGAIMAVYNTDTKEIAYPTSAAK
jgi:outer membrane protein assembly factor BamB